MKAITAAKMKLSITARQEKSDNAMRFMYLALLLPLAGCGYTVYLSDADENGGTVNLVTQINHDGAVEKASEHCGQYHLVARVVSTDTASNSMRFVCQPPGDPTVTRDASDPRHGQP